VDGTALQADWQAEYQQAVSDLEGHKDAWARTTVAERMKVVQAMKNALMTVAEDWALTAARHKLIPEGSPLVGEEWISGPYAVMAALNGLMTTFSQIEGKAFVDLLPMRRVVTGQTAIQVMPHNLWERLLFSGVKAEIWMKEGISENAIKAHAAVAYDVPIAERKGKVALVLGAGNINSIPPLDVFQKVFLENQVTVLKMNPVNEYLTDFLKVALGPLIERSALRILRGGAEEGAWLTAHPLIEELHITGAASTHDAIVWGPGEEGARNKAAGTPKTTKRFTSELGAVCPTIIVPGPWSAADLQFQAEHVATQKLHNSGFNCVACQMLIMPKTWDKAGLFMDSLRAVLGMSTRPAYYPGAHDRLAVFEGSTKRHHKVHRGKAPAVIINEHADDEYFRTHEIFGPALSVKEIEGEDAEAYLVAAIDWANDHLFGTLGANIIIHPKTIKQIGRIRFEELIADLRYGTIAINAWTGVGFLVTTCPWGAFPGHTLDDVQSGIGTAHNTFMLDETERVVVEQPWRPFPRGLVSGQFSLLPRPPWFITHERQDTVGKLLTEFQYKPSWFKLPKIFYHAILG
jgi:acyl-CoA reductase-like NAD-dependent aldehyde dehydrogenase